MSTLLALDGRSARAVALAQLAGASIARTASLAAGARTWSVAVLVVCASTWLRSGEHLGDTIWGAAVGSALTAVTTRTIVHARRPSPSRSAVQSSSPSAIAADTDTPTDSGVRP